MNSLDRQYVSLLKKIKEEGIWENNRTGIKAKAIVNAIIQHDMNEGFPLLCIKKTPFKSVAVELEFFLRGLQEKQWLKDRGCNIWNEWCNPKKHPYGTDEDSKEKMANENDLGRIYGVQWRDFRGIYKNSDQIKDLVNLLQRDPTSRRAIVTSWNPCELGEMALPPCHVMFQVMILGGKLHLTWYQRSVDTPLGLPFNIASYGLLLHLLARELNVEEGTLTGMLNNVHYYENQDQAVDEIIERGIYHENPEADKLKLPIIKTCFLSSLSRLIHNTPEPSQKEMSEHQWTHLESKIENYNPLPKIEIPIAV